MSSQSKGATSSVPKNEPLARILGVRKPLDPQARFWVGILAFVLPFLGWCAISYVPFIWHPQVLVADAGDTRVPGENSYIAVGDRVDLDVVIMRNRDLDAAHARRVTGDRVNPIYLQAPHAVARAMYTAFTTAPERDGDAWLHESLLQSCKVIFWGFFWSALFGLPLGVLCGTFPFFARLFEPFIDFVRYMPAPVFGALALTVLGLNDAPKITIIFIGTFFQMVLIVSNTTRSVEVSLLHAAQTLGANKRQLVWNVVVPGAVPGWYRDMRILIGWAWTYLVVAELIGEKSGLSAWLYQQQRYRHFDNVYAAIVIIGLVGLITDQFLALLGRYLFPWETGQTGLARALRAMRRALPQRARLART
jgi:NitT/TauT family transport system permease protein